MSCCTNCFYGCLYFCQQMHENYIRDNKPVQIILSIIGGMLLMVILLAIFGAFRHPACAAPQEPYYNLYSKSWPQTVCKEITQLGGACVEKLPANLVIHSLSPVVSAKQAYLTHCQNPEAYDPTKLKDIETQLAKAWPAVDNSSHDQTHWRHQWERSGVCSNLGLVKYFSKGLDLDAQFELSKWLDEGGVKPDDTKSQKVEDFAKVLDAKIGKDQYFLRCVQITKTINNIRVTENWLLDISVCVQYQDETKTTKCTTDLIPDPTKVCKDPFYYVVNYTKHP